MMVKMTKKKISILGIILMIVLSGLFYFKPLRLSELVNENRSVLITHEELYIKNGIPYIDSTTYNEIKEEQKIKIIDLLEQYPYRRTFGTFFSDGSLSGMLSEGVNIYIYDGYNNLINTICVIDSNNLAVNGKRYVQKKSSVFIKELLEIINK